ncbi:MAG TPA: uroporphyrinogen-III C-methyltransferase [Opitutaceae bacterium]|nr:uroporphyrinogen-III C-methyltransferase [Opitutaceae bacterium]
MPSTTFSAPRVFLVGAGPGDPRLITLRGRDLIEQAEVIIHDELANRALLDWAAAGAELVYVGKRAGHHHADQAEINRLLVAHARTRRRVVRLKGGDPLVFGRGGEEAAALREAGIAFEIVPGVTAAVGVAATTEIPLTHRGVSSAVLFVTGHECAEKSGTAVDWDAIARVRCTIVVYMGLKAARAIVARLLAAGADSELPVALVSRATLPDQQVLVATLGGFEQQLLAREVPSPALLVIGEVVRQNPQAAVALAALAPATTE